MEACICSPSTWEPQAGEPQAREYVSKRQLAPQGTDHRLKREHHGSQLGNLLRFLGVT